MSGWNSMSIGRGDHGLQPTPREPNHQPHPEAAAAEKTFTSADRRMLETEQRLNRHRAAPTSPSASGASDDLPDVR